MLRNLIFSWKSTGWLRQHHTEFDLIKVNSAITHFPSDVNAVHFVHNAGARSRVHKVKAHCNLYRPSEKVTLTIEEIAGEAIRRGHDFT